MPVVLWNMWLYAYAYNRELLFFIISYFHVMRAYVHCSHWIVLSVLPPYYNYVAQTFFDYVFISSILGFAKSWDDTSSWIAYISFIEIGCTLAQYCALCSNILTNVDYYTDTLSGFTQNLNLEPYASAMRSFGSSRIIFWPFFILSSCYLASRFFVSLGTELLGNPMLSTDRVHCSLSRSQRVASGQDSTQSTGLNRSATYM